MQNDKTVGQLYKELKDRYSIDDLESSLELVYLHKLLQLQASKANGNFVYIPGEFFRNLIKKYLDYSFPSLQKNNPMNSENPSGLDANLKTSADSSDQLSLHKDTASPEPIISK